MQPSLVTICRWKTLAALVLAALAAPVIWALALQLTGNVHEIIPGQAYRSAQLGADQLAATLRKYRIRTVLNLRGTNPGAPWFDEEVVVTAAHGAAHLDFGLSAGEDLSDAQLAALVDILRAAPRPILIHCAGGADRTGLASALFRLAVERHDAADAVQELSSWYGHVPWLISRTRAMDRSFERLRSKQADANNRGASRN